SQDAGLPIRIAVATVSGLSTGRPSTSGAAPSAWNPNIRGGADDRPAAAYSTNPAQYALMLPALPTGIARMSGARPRSSQTSKAAVFCPSSGNGLTQITSVTGC